MCEKDGGTVTSSHNTGAMESYGYLAVIDRRKYTVTLNYDCDLLEKGVKNNGVVYFDNRNDYTGIYLCIQLISGDKLYQPIYVSATDLGLENAIDKYIDMIN